jgi:hypothetical protein
MAKSDPTKDPKFQQVVKAFLTTPPKRHEDMKKRSTRAAFKRKAKKKVRESS